MFHAIQEFESKTNESEKCKKESEKIIYQRSKSL
jgi:hypothetical protein